MMKARRFLCRTWRAICGLSVSINPSRWVSPTTQPPPWFVVSPHGGFSSKTAKHLSGSRTVASMQTAQPPLAPSMQGMPPSKCNRLENTEKKNMLQQHAAEIHCCTVHAPLPCTPSHDSTCDKYTCNMKSNCSRKTCFTNPTMKAVHA